MRVVVHDFCGEQAEEMICIARHEVISAAAIAVAYPGTGLDINFIITPDGKIMIGNGDRRQTWDRVEDFLATLTTAAEDDAKIDAELEEMEDLIGKEEVKQ
jgi:hypothetical protein